MDKSYVQKAFSGNNYEAQSSEVNKYVNKLLAKGYRVKIRVYAPQKTFRYQMEYHTIVVATKDTACDIGFRR